MLIESGELRTEGVWRKGQDAIARTILSLRFCGITETPSRCDG
jgi:hypothetical protein